MSLDNRRINLGAMRSAELLDAEVKLKWALFTAENAPKLKPAFVDILGVTDEKWTSIESNFDQESGHLRQFLKLKLSTSYTGSCHIEIRLNHLMRGYSEPGLKFDPRKVVKLPIKSYDGKNISFL